MSKIKLSHAELVSLIKEELAQQTKVKQLLDRKKRIETLVKNLKLEKCIDTLVGGSLLKGVSGG